MAKLYNSKYFKKGSERKLTRQARKYRGYWHRYGIKSYLSKKR